MGKITYLKNKNKDSIKNENNKLIEDDLKPFLLVFKKNSKEKYMLVDVSNNSMMYNTYIKAQNKMFLRQLKYIKKPFSYWKKLYSDYPIIEDEVYKYIVIDNKKSIELYFDIQ